jgi:hypothetical protein
LQTIGEASEDELWNVAYVRQDIWRIASFSGKKIKRSEVITIKS